ncbi:FecR family protein [Larkinella sp. C7]|jgi:transmembrane sensor|uniref:FecR family protein n=1 Tax=Larkinella sp. C7 TaxID=2576607 RepID=UPI00111113FE|nr:FecR domain-containing protein [Larkinella sp. C7]
MQSELSKALLFAYFEGTTTPIQTQRIQRWRQKPENREWFFACLEEWESQRLQYEADPETAFHQFRERIQQLESPPDTPVLPLATPSVRRAWLVAASLALLTLLAVWQRDRGLYRTYSTQYGELKTVGLPDGSRVTLNAHSSLRLSRWTFGRTSREVWLTGEAEFSVRHLPTHQRFIVRTPDELEVVVLGTEFVVSSRRQGSRIVLNSGKVAFRSLQGSAPAPVVMKPGDVATVKPGGQVQMQSHQSVERYRVWKEHRFLFDRTPLSQVLATLEEHFGETVQLADSELVHRQITGTFRAETAPVLLDLLTTLTRTQVVETDSGKVMIPLSPLNP